MILDENLFGKDEPVMIREFRDEESLKELQQLFDDAGIPHAVFDSESRFDVTFSYDRSRQTFKLFVPTDYAEEARKISADLDAAVIAGLPKDYYLFDFSNDELKALIIKSYEWSPLDVTLAKILLEQRGEDPENEELVRKEEEAISSFNAPERIDKSSLFWGYFFSVLGGLIGIGFVIYILTSKKTTHDGVKMLRYDDESRKHAYYMIPIIIFVNVVMLIIRLTIDPV